MQPDVGAGLLHSSASGTRLPTSTAEPADTGRNPFLRPFPVVLFQWLNNDLLSRLSLWLILP